MRRGCAVASTRAREAGICPRVAYTSGAGALSVSVPSFQAWRLRGPAPPLPQVAALVCLFPTLFYRRFAGPLFVSSLFSFVVMYKL